MLDYFDLDSQLSQEERLIRDTAREFVQNNVQPDIAKHWEAGTFPKDLITEMGDLDFYAPNLEGYGLPGVSETAYGLLMQELEACDSGVRSMASVQGALVMYPIHAYGSDEQKESWLPKLASGEVVGCFGLTEPEHGSNPSGMETTAEYEDGGYLPVDRKRESRTHRYRTLRWSGHRINPTVEPSAGFSLRPIATASRRTRSKRNSRCGRRSPAR